MTINYVMTVRAEIILDEDFSYQAMSNEPHSIQEYISKIYSLMEEYGFTSGAIVDAETGELFVEMERDCNDLLNNNIGYCNTNNYLK